MVCDFMNYVSMRAALWVSSALFLTSITVKVLIRSLTFTRVLHSWADLKQRAVRVFLCVTHSFFGGRNYVTWTKSKMQRYERGAGRWPGGSPEGGVSRVISSFKFRFIHGSQPLQRQHSSVEQVEPGHRAVLATQPRPVERPSPSGLGVT